VRAQQRLSLGTRRWTLLTGKQRRIPWKKIGSRRVNAVEKVVRCAGVRMDCAVVGVGGVWYGAMRAAEGGYARRLLRCCGLACGQVEVEFRHSVAAVAPFGGACTARHRRWGDSESAAGQTAAYSTRRGGGEYQTVCGHRAPCHSRARGTCTHDGAGNVCRTASRRRRRRA